MLPAGEKSALHFQGILHPYLHLAAFACLAALAMSTVRASHHRLVLFLGILVFGWATEFIEHLLGGFPVELADVFADSVGVVLGSLLVLLRNPI